MTATLLAAESLTLGYGRREVLRDVSIELIPGELLAVIGPNGAGKTTLLRALTRLEKPSAGRVVLDGRDIGATPARQAARRIAFVPQVADWGWAATVRESVALGRAPHAGWLRPLSANDKIVVENALTRLDLMDKASRRIDTLSGGEQQRVRLARALAQSPGVLLLDEPTTHLDPRFQADLLQLVRDAAQEQGIAAAVTLHDLNLVGPWADRVALLKQGEILAIGKPGEVLTPERLGRLYDIPLAVGPHPVTGDPVVALMRKKT